MLFVFCFSASLFHTPTKARARHATTRAWQPSLPSLRLPSRSFPCSLIRYNRIRSCILRISSDLDHDLIFRGKRLHAKHGQQRSKSPWLAGWVIFSKFAALLVYDGYRLPQLTSKRKST